MLDESIQHQKKLGISRNTIGEFHELYKGVVGGSLTREAWECCQTYMNQHPEYLQDIRYTRLREEFIFHTILFNMPQLKDKIVSGTRGGRHGWLWDEKKKDYALVNHDSWIKLKSDPDNLFIRSVSSESTELLEEILRDIKTPYSLERNIN